MPNGPAINRARSRHPLAGGQTGDGIVNLDYLPATQRRVDQAADICHMEPIAERAQTHANLQTATLVTAAPSVDGFRSIKMRLSPLLGRRAKMLP